MFLPVCCPAAAATRPSCLPIGLIPLRYSALHDALNSCGLGFAAWKGWARSNLLHKNTRSSVDSEGPEVKARSSSRRTLVQVVSSTGGMVTKVDQVLGTRRQGTWEPG